MTVKTTTTYYKLEKFQRGGPVVDADIAGNMDIIDTGMEYNRVALIDLAANGAGYHFDGANDDVSHAADQANVDFDADDDFYIEMEIMPLDVTRTTDYLINKEAGGIGYGLYLNQDDLYIRCDDGTTDASAIIGNAVFANNVKACVLVSFDRSGDATAYIDGKAVGTIDISGVVKTLDSAGVLHIGNDSAGANEFYGEIYIARVGNKTMTAVEARSLANGSPVPYKYLAASQTNRLSEPDFATHAKWSAVGDFDDTGGNGAYTWASNTTSTLTQASADIAVALLGMHRYKFTYTVAVSTAPDGDLVMTITTGIASAAVALPFTVGTHVVEFTTKDTPGDFVISATCSTGTEGTFTIDDVALVPIGCVLQLEPDGIGTTQWSDKSGNYLSAIVTGATAINVPPDQGGVRVASGDLASGDANAYAFAWQNPEAVNILVQRAIIDVTTAGGTASSTLDVGTADDATTTSKNLLEAANLETGGLFDNITDGGTAGKSRQRMDARGGTTDWITGQILDANAANLVGKYYIEYIPV